MASTARQKSSTCPDPKNPPGGWGGRVSLPPTMERSATALLPTRTNLGRAGRPRYVVLEDDQSISESLRISGPRRPCRLLRNVGKRSVDRRIARRVLADRRPAELGGRLAGQLLERTIEG